MTVPMRIPPRPIKEAAKAAKRKMEFLQEVIFELASRGDEPGAARVLDSLANDCRIIADSVERLARIARTSEPQPQPPQPQPPQPRQRAVSLNVETRKGEQRTVSITPVKR